MPEFNLGNIDPMFFFWTFLSYIIILFHSWRIDKIWKEIKGLEVLFLSGALGYFYLLMTKYLIYPIIEFIPKWQQNIYFTFQNLPLFVVHKESEPFVQSFIEYLFFGITFPTILFTIFMVITVIIFKILRYFLDPTGEIYRDIKRFNIYDKYKIGMFLSLGIPSIMLSIALIILSVGLIFYSFAIIRNTSMAFWSIVDTMQWMLALIFSIIMIYLSIILIYVYFKDLFEPIIIDTFKKIRDYYIDLSEKRSLESKIYSKWFAWFEKHKFALIIFQMIWLTLMSLNQVRDGKMSLTQFGLMVSPFIIILILPKKWLSTLYLKIIKNLNLTEK